ncbi:MAG: S-adenosyl-l-methionine hydroxide adenosyltransferase family protein [Candidatus Omnitrophica bacterium]|nr:S-adenosyl-l-methionine hydroxide adenosyltransferase family protein [Candidatus Omnitrophota bacterium]
MRCISLLTDFGLSDNFVGVMKAVILKINPSVSIIDISHNIEPQNVFQASFLLKHSFKYFPKGTIHLAIVDPGVGTDRKAILVKTRNYFFIAPDNGVLSLTLEEESPQEIIQIDNPKYFLKPVSHTFHGRDIFSPVAGYLSRGISIYNFGKPIKKIKKIHFPKPEIKKDKLYGQIIYIDNFGNLVTNISKDTFLGFVRKRKFVLRIRNKIINRISTSYQDSDKKETIALFNSFDSLEISIREGSAKEALKAEISTPIEIIIVK